MSKKIKYWKNKLNFWKKRAKTAEQRNQELTRENKMLKEKLSACAGTLQNIGKGTVSPN